MTLHITSFLGSNALSSFRAQQLLPQLQAVHDKICGVSARFVHLVAAESALDEGLQTKLAALLTYGDVYEGGEEGDCALAAARWWLHERRAAPRLSAERVRLRA